LELLPSNGYVAKAFETLGKMYQQLWRSVAYLFTKMLLDQCFLQRIADGRVHKCQPVSSKSDLSTSLTAEKVQLTDNGHTSGEDVQALSFCLGLTEMGYEELNLANRRSNFCRTSLHTEWIKGQRLFRSAHCHADFPALISHVCKCC